LVVRVYSGAVATGGCRRGVHAANAEHRVDRDLDAITIKPDGLP
jgi:hypothetical protein